MNESDCSSRRDEFWDTAPVFEGHREIWDALKAAAVAVEGGDFDLAQAIIDGAGISLPNGESTKMLVRARKSGLKHICFYSFLYGRSIEKGSN